ncbi:MAG: hypothetical protein AAGI69_11565 [Cyanobacteria bacterium P01_H01_bin.21]
MRYWEFLIQQEGDQTWLPLETRQVEILEGRYRMAAHTSYDSTSVEVRVSQLLLDEIPPRRRVRKRKTSTSDSGLLAIFPFIQLSPGRWEIDCNSPDVIDDFLGEGGWHYSVQLQVTPRDDEEWEPDWSETVADQSLDDAGPLTTDVDSSETDDAPAEFQLQLKQQAYVTQLGQSLTLSGTFSASRLLRQGQLWIQLRDPQTASTVREIAFDVPNESLFAPFSVAVTLPDELSTQVILGALSLIERGKPKTVLASASFTVTMGLAQMLDAIATQPDLEFEEEISIFPGSTEAFIPSPEKSEALLSSETPIVPKEIIPSEGLTLPPQIKPIGDVELERPPELPTFPAETGSFRANIPEPDDEPAASARSETLEDTADDSADGGGLSNVDQDSIDVDELDVDEPQEDVEPLPFANPKVFEIGTIEDDDLDLELATAALESEPTEETVAPRNDGLTTRFAPKKPPVSQPVSQRDLAATNIDRAFQRLQLRERFWQKLSLFTQDGYRHSLEVQQALHASEDRLEGNQSNEFVDYEPSPQRYSSYESEPPPQEEPIQVLPPVLSVPEQELVAGEWIAIKVRVPTTSYQPYVKVWMNDLQTRTMIDAPRLLMQFIPNENDELETLMRVRVPTGCLELQFAAISVDMATLQESRKVIQNRRVMPPDDSLAIFDDWDV